MFLFWVPADPGAPGRYRPGLPPRSVINSLDLGDGKGVDHTCRGDGVDQVVDDDDHLEATEAGAVDGDAYGEPDSHQTLQELFDLVGGVARGLTPPTCLLKLAGPDT